MTSSFTEDHLESEIAEFGRGIFSSLEENSPGYFDPRFYTEKFLSWGMEDEEFKVSLFRFVDVLPSLPDAASVIKHVTEYFQAHREKIPPVLRTVVGMRPESISSAVMGKLIRDQVERMAHLFIVGANPEAALKTLRKMRKKGLAFTVDLLGEAAVSEVEAREYLNRYLHLLDILGKELPGWKEAAPLIAGHRGESTPLNISVKPSSLYSQIRPLNHHLSEKLLRERLGEILVRAKSFGGFVYVDMEDSSLTSITLRAFQTLLETDEFKNYERCGIVLQAYLRRTESDLQALLEWVRRRGTPIAVRLVKGAYWDTETITSRLAGWPIPVWQKKQNTDAVYERLSRKLLENTDSFLPAFASHNIRSLSHAVKAAELMGVPKTHFELQALYGMGDPIVDAFSARGFLVREYSPVGELLPGMAYFVRRLLENTSNEGFLRLSFHDRAEKETLLRRPQFDSTDRGDEHCVPADRITFRNAPLSDFSLETERRKIAQALDRLRSELMIAPKIARPFACGAEAPLVKSISSVSPERKSLFVARVELTDVTLTEQAIADLHDYLPTWSQTSVQERAQLLRRTAEVIERRREEITAAIIVEAGKPWAEADGDVAEAIDFLNYYALEAEQRLVVQYPGQLVGEDNRYFYEARGVTAVIAPWNFPFAIPCGMFSAALVAGNTVVLKPAEQTSWIASLLFDCFHAAGIPPRAAAFLPGIGEEIGPVLVSHPLVSTIVFTGSMAVGLEITRRAAESSSQALHVKRVITEMGGKNAIVVDDDADLDEAVKGILQSAFGYAGQKCSACSRVIAVRSVYERLVARLGEAVRDLQLLPASDPGAFLGPVIDETAFKRIQAFIEQAKGECTTVIEGGAAANLSEGFFVRPTLVAGVPENHRILTEEIFGPVLAVVHEPDFPAAIAAANRSQYGLTGAVYSRNPRNLEYARRHFEVGNLYLNRGSTGALVNRQPFGGMKMSGVGSKAGGPDYLMQFVYPRSVTENTLRRGFAPSLAN